MKYLIGSLVVTPTGRIARVIGYDEDGRLDILYQDCAPRLAPAWIWPKNVKPANEQPYVK